MDMAKSRPSIDHGWAWTIVVANFLNAFLVLGNARSLGMFFKPLMSLLDSNATVVSTIITARMLTAMASVLVAPVLSEHFSERKVVMAGGVIACCSYISVYFADNISYCIVYGILSGVAQGFVMVPTRVIVGKYFKKRRAVASSIGSLGGSIGQLVLPPFYAWLIHEFTVRGAFLILGAMCLHIVVAGALQRPIDLTDNIAQSSNKRVEIETKDVCKEETETMTNNLDRDDNSHVINSDDEIDDEKRITIVESSTLAHEMGIQGKDSQTNRKVPSKNGKNQKIQHSFCTRVRSVISTQLDVKLFAIPTFLVFTILVGGSFGFYRPVKLFLVPSAKEDIIPDQQASLLLTVGAITDICSRLVLGYVTDMRIIQPYQVLATAGITAGIFICSFPLADHYWSMMLVSAFIGLTSEVRIYLAMPIVADLVGVSRMALALGWIGFISMLSQAALIPLFGYIRDVRGSYDLTFYLCGAFIIVMSSGIFTLVFLEKRSRSLTETTMTLTERKARD